MYKYFRPNVRSRHPSHAPLRAKGAFPLFPFKSVIRFGSVTEFNDGRIEINSVQAVKNSSSKLLMKTCFTKDEVKTADWWIYNTEYNLFQLIGGGDGILLSDLPYPIISKSHFGSRNQGNKKHNTKEELAEWLKGKNLDNYLFEKYYNYAREYRLHITKNGCFYTCRKMIKEDTPQEDRWFRNDEHCVWILEENELFDKPVNWDKVIKESVKALESVGLDIGAVDLRIQSSRDKNDEIRKDLDFIIVEINSAPSFGDVTLGKYKSELTKLLTQKNNE